MIDFLCIPQLFKIVPWKRRDIDVIDDKKKKKKKKKNVYIRILVIFGHNFTICNHFYGVTKYVCLFSIFVRVGGVTSPQILSLRMLFCH